MDASIAVRPRFDDIARDPAIVRSILDGVDVALFFCDRDGVLLHLNGAAAALISDMTHLGVDPRPGVPLATVLGDRDGTFDALLNACFDEGEPASRSYTLPGIEEGEEGARVVLSASPLGSRESDPPEMAMVRVRDNPKAQGRVERLNERLQRTYRALQLERRLSRRDPLTGLLNRREFFNALKGEMDYAVRYDQPMSLVCIDVDRFKSVNDRYGHPAGDEVLKQLGSLIAKTMRRLDKPGRVGGEEFAIVLPGVSRDGAARAAERLRTAIEAMAITYEGTRIDVTASFGVVELDRGREEDAQGQRSHDGGRAKGADARGADRSALYERGDAALYRAKRKGRNRVELG